MIEEDKLQQRMLRIAELVHHLDSEEADPGIRAQSRELIESVMDFHGEALERILQCLQGAGDAGQNLLNSLAADPVVASVLLLYGLHPLDFETRVRQVIERVRPTLRSYGADAELSNLTGGVVRVRLRGVDSAFTARTVKTAVEEEIYRAAPDAASLVLLGLEKFAAPDFVPLEKIGVAPAPAEPAAVGMSDGLSWAASAHANAGEAGD
jgi:Fe-S cluster biogenesis protein NfuA